MTDQSTTVGVVLRVRSTGESEPAAEERPLPTVGVLGQAWRGAVDPGGALICPDGWRIDWWVAADDRWHDPQDPAERRSVRQRRLGGTAVIETRLRVPKGDVISRIYAVADGGGMTVIELENTSPMPVAVALSTRELRSARPASDVPAQGITLPPQSAIHPLSHGTVARFALAHDGSGAGPLPARLPTPEQVVRGWTIQLERASRLVLPEFRLVEAVAAARCELALGGLDDPEDDPVGFLLGAHELVRLGAPVSDWIPEIAAAAERVIAAARREGLAWDADRALVAADALFVADGDRRAAADLRSLAAGVGPRSSTTFELPSGIRAVAWVEDRLVRPAGDDVAVLVPGGVPERWRNDNFECHHLPAGAGRWASFGWRWHGTNAAVLWEIDGPPGLTVRSGFGDGTWATTAAYGDALLTVS